jgi:hypothetical protein
MRKISKRRPSDLDRKALDGYRDDTRQRNIQGATITSRPVSQDIDLAAFFARPASDATVTGAVSGKPEQAAGTGDKTVSLSDGTQITFATISPSDSVELV